MRPRGEVREALAQASVSLGREGFTWRDAAIHAGVGFDCARMTLENMARAGQVQRDGLVRVPGVARPMVKYVPRQAEEGAGAHSLAAVVHGWADFT